MSRSLKTKADGILQRFGLKLSRFRPGIDDWAVPAVTPAPDAAPGGAAPRIVLLHHQACTGGTLFSKCLAALPDLALISEIHPYYIVPEPFSPSAPVDQYQQSYGALPRDLLADHFRNQMDVLARHAACGGKTLCIRDHSHHDYMRADIAPDQPVRDFMSGVAAASLVTIRHPLDSFLSLQKAGWTRGIGDSLAEYASRYHRFLDDFADVPQIRYEDLTTTPEDTMRQMTEILGLTYDPAFLQRFAGNRFSGDSGRSGAQIAPRARRAVPDAVKAQQSAEAYRSLCDRMGYPA